VTTHPDPLIAADVDLRDFGFMPLDVLRLRDSDLAALATGDEFKAAVLLWCVAWHQVPAGSLPDDDRLLARYSGAGATWKKVRDEALRGFVRCADGRLYHATICEKARESWDAKLKQRERTKAATLAREQRRRAQQTQRDVERDESRNDERHEQRDVERDVVQGTGTVKGQGQGIRPSGESAPAPAHVREAEPPPSPTRAGQACLALKAAGIPDVAPSHPKLQALLAAGVSDAELREGAQAAQRAGKATFAYTLAVVEGRRRDAANAAPVPPGAPPPRDDRKSRQLLTAALLTGAASAIEPETIDVDARIVPPRALG
jgi:hypothetical protein